MSKFMNSIKVCALLAFAAVAAAFLLSGCSSSGQEQSSEGPELDIDSGVDTIEIEDEYTAVKADVNLGSIVVHSGSGSSVIVDRTDYPELDVEVVDGTLTVSEQHGHFEATDASSCYVTIEVPFDLDVESVDASSAEGSVDVEVMTADSFNVNVDNGTLSFLNCEGDQANLTVGEGSMTVTSVNAFEGSSVDASTSDGVVYFGDDEQGKSYHKDAEDEPAEGEAPRVVERPLAITATCTTGDITLL